MINFSDSGVLIATDELFDINETVILDFNIGEREVVVGMVLRTEKAENGSLAHRVAIKFDSVSKEQQDRFYRYIMTRQVKNIKRGWPN
jgi:hypothetical protein